MTAKLVSDKQMAALRGVAILGMQTPIGIQRRSEAPPPAGGDYGDDFLAFTDTGGWRTVKGWFYSTPTPMQDADTGAIITANTYRLYLPVGTDILPGDRVTVGIDAYTVSDTTAEGTWLPLLTCSLRKRD